MTKPRAGQSGNWDRERADRLQEDVERMQKDVERLERWKAEATEVMSGLRELGKALGLRPGVQITGPAALAEVARLTAERDALAGLLAEFVDSEPCSLDHHGYCQSHGHLDEGECHMARARAVLAGSDADASDTQPADQEDQS